MLNFRAWGLLILVCLVSTSGVAFGADEWWKRKNWHMSPGPKLFVPDNISNKPPLCKAMRGPARLFPCWTKAGQRCLDENGDLRIFFRWYFTTQKGLAKKQCKTAGGKFDAPEFNSFGDGKDVCVIDTLIPDTVSVVDIQSSYRGVRTKGSRCTHERTDTGIRTECAINSKFTGGNSWVLTCGYYTLDYDYPSPTIPNPDKVGDENSIVGDSCTVNPQKLYCPGAGLKSVNDPGCKANCIEGYTAVCEPSRCDGKTWWGSVCGCK